MSFQQRDDFLEALRLEQTSSYCAEFTALARGLGREIDAFVRQARQEPRFFSSGGAQTQALRTYESRLSFDIAEERFLAVAPHALAVMAQGLKEGSSVIRFVDDQTTLDEMDEFTAELGRRILVLRNACRAANGLEPVNDF